MLVVTIFRITPCGASLPPNGSVSLLGIRSFGYAIDCTSTTPGLNVRYSSIACHDSSSGATRRLFVRFYAYNSRMTWPLPSLVTYTGRFSVTKN